MTFPNDVDNVMEELEFRFERTELLVKAQIENIQKAPNIQESKPEKIIE